MTQTTERPDIGIDRKKVFDFYYHGQFMESSPQQATQSGMMTMLGLLESGKLKLRCTSDWGDLMKLLGERHENPQPGFSREEAQHDGTAQSVVNEVIPRERSGRPDVDSQREA